MNSMEFFKKIKQDLKKKFNFFTHLTEFFCLEN